MNICANNDNISCVKSNALHKRTNPNAYTQQVLTNGIHVMYANIPLSVRICT